MQERSERFYSHVQDASSQDLMITASDDTPTKIQKRTSVLKARTDDIKWGGKQHHWQQAVRCAKDPPGAVVIVANDTGVFVLLLHHYQNEGLASAVFMESPVQQRPKTHVKATVQ